MKAFDQITLRELEDIHSSAPKGFEAAAVLGYVVSVIIAQFEAECEESERKGSYC